LPSERAGEGAAFVERDVRLGEARGRALAADVARIGEVTTVDVDDETCRAQRVADAGVPVGDRAGPVADLRSTRRVVRAEGLETNPSAPARAHDDRVARGAGDGAELRSTRAPGHRHETARAGRAERGRGLYAERATEVVLADRADTTFIGEAVAVVVAAVADLDATVGDRAGRSTGEVAAIAVLVDAVAADLRRARATPGVGVVAVVADRTTRRRARAVNRAARTHRHPTVTVVVVVVVTAFVDLSVAVVVEVVADLRSRRNAGAATVVRDSVAVVVERVAADLVDGGTGDGAAQRCDRRTCGATRDAEALAGADTPVTRCSTTRATRIGAADAAGEDAALLATAVGRAEVRARVDVAARETAVAVREHDARLADAAEVVGTDVVAAAREGRDADHAEKEPVVRVLHRRPFHPFSRTRERAKFCGTEADHMIHHLGRPLSDQTGWCGGRSIYRCRERPPSCSERDAGTQREVVADSVDTDEVIDVGTSNLGVRVVEAGRALDVQPRKRVHPKANLTAELEHRPRVQAAPDLSAGVEDGGRSDAEVEGDHLVESEGCTRRSSEDAFVSDRALGVELSEAIEEVARPDVAAKVEPEVLDRKCLELCVDHAVRGDDRGGSRDAEQVKPDTEVEAEMPGAVVDHRGGRTVALTAPDELDAIVFAQRMPLGVGLAAVGSPTAILASTECFEVALDLREISAETIDLRGVDEHGVEARAEQVPLFRVAPHPILATGVLQAIEPRVDLGEIHGALSLGDAWRRQVVGVEAVDDHERRAAFDATTALAVDVCVTLFDIERDRSFLADDLSVPSATFDASDRTATFHDQSMRFTRNLGDRRVRDGALVGADHFVDAMAPVHLRDGFCPRAEARTGLRAVEVVHQSLEIAETRGLHVHAHVLDLHELVVGDATSGELRDRVDAEVVCIGRRLDAVLGVRDGREAEGEHEADDERDADETEIAVHWELLSEPTLGGFGTTEIRRPGLSF
jgi:hypothetical protein